MQKLELTLDVCFTEDENLRDVLSALTKGTDVDVDVLQERSPSGWPEVSFEGTYLDLAVVVVRYASGDLAGQVELLESLARQARNAG